MCHIKVNPSVLPQVEECHLPGLGVALTLDYKPDMADEAVSPLVSYVSGLLLGTNGKVRTWFSMFIRNGQQVRRNNSCIQTLDGSLLCKHMEFMCVSHFRGKERAAQCCGRCGGSCCWSWWPSYPVRAVPTFPTTVTWTLRAARGTLVCERSMW